MKKRIRILATVSGAPGWIPLYKCLTQFTDASYDIYGCDILPQTAGSYYAKKHFTVPIGSSGNYIKTIRKIVMSENIDIILPSGDPELLPLAKNTDAFKKIGVLIPLSEPKALEIAFDKLKLYQFLKEHSLQNPEFVSVNSWVEFKNAVEMLGYPYRPICFKPAISWGSRGFRIIDAKKDIGAPLFQEKPTNTYISFDQIKMILKQNKTFPTLLVMEYLPGEEYTVDVFVRNKKILYVLPRKRVKMVGGITTEGVVEKNEAVISLAKKVAESLPFEYSIGIQCKYDRENKPKVIEINPRLQGTSIISYAAGVNLPDITIRSLLGQEIPKLKVKYGMHMYRHWQEIFFYKNKKYFST